MRKSIVGLLAAGVALTACTQTEGPANDNVAAPSSSAPALELTRLDCGTITIKKFNDFFSDNPGLYENVKRDVTDSCYLIRRGDRLLLWDTGITAALKGRVEEGEQTTVTLSKSLTEQLAALNVKPSDIDIVGISHSHFDHTGQASAFPNARLIIGAGDFVEASKTQAEIGESPIAPWLKDNPNVTKATADVDVFGDGSVVALHLPGHTPDHLALLVKLPSGPVLLTGDLYHSREAREKRGVPPFNTSREQTLASMDKFEKLAKETGAKVVIQHEPRDISLLPAFPEAAK